MKETNNHIVLGVMSGTSLDGLDLALCSFKENKGKFNYSILQAKTVSYSVAWSKALANLHKTSAENYAEIHHLYGRYIAAQINLFIGKSKVKPGLISSHGHTIFHQPQKGFTSQLGCGATIAAKTGITTISDLRSVDVALGGQGAPLVPIGDKLLFGDYQSCLNLGGIANISFYENGKRIAFDICPVNMALNFYARKLGKEYDVDGEMASEGKCNTELLNALNNLSFYKQKPPRSLAREWFETDMLPLIEKHNLNTKDALNTFCEHAAEQIAEVLNTNRVKNVLISGGGTFNSFLISRMEEKYKGKIIIPDNATINFKEALIFAFLGWLRYQNKTNTLSSVTGASQNSCGGAIYSPHLQTTKQ